MSYLLNSHPSLFAPQDPETALFPVSSSPGSAQMSCPCFLGPPLIPADPCIQPVPYLPSSPHPVASCTMSPGLKGVGGGGVSHQLCFQAERLSATVTVAAWGRAQEAPGGGLASTEPIPGLQAPTASQLLSQQDVEEASVPKDPAGNKGRRPSEAEL